MDCIIILSKCKLTFFLLTGWQFDVSLLCGWAALSMVCGNKNQLRLSDFQIFIKSEWKSLEGKLRCLLFPHVFAESDSSRGSGSSGEAAYRYWWTVCLTASLLSFSECRGTYWRTVMAVGHLCMDFTATFEKLRLSGIHCSMKSNK